MAGHSSIERKAYEPRCDGDSEQIRNPSSDKGASELCQVWVPHKRHVGPDERRHHTEHQIEPEFSRAKPDQHKRKRDRQGYVDHEIYREYGSSQARAPQSKIKQPTDQRAVAGYIGPAINREDSLDESEQDRDGCGYRNCLDLHKLDVRAGVSAHPQKLRQAQAIRRAGNDPVR